MPALADLLDEASILRRVDFGALLTITGHHPELGGFVVCQTIAGATIVSKLMPASDGARDLEAVAEAWIVIAGAQHQARPMKYHGRRISFLHVPRDCPIGIAQVHPAGIDRHQPEGNT